MSVEPHRSTMQQRTRWHEIRRNGCRWAGVPHRHDGGLYWHRASRVTADPGWGRDGLVEPGVHSVAQDAWIAALIQSASESARLNKIAAVWTAATALLAAIASVLSVAHT